MLFFCSRFQVFQLLFGIEEVDAVVVAIRMFARGIVLLWTCALNTIPGVYFIPCSLVCKYYRSLTTNGIARAVWSFIPQYPSIFCSDWCNAAHTTTPYPLHYWQHWSRATGGAVTVPLVRCVCFIPAVWMLARRFDTQLLADGGN